MAANVTNLFSKVTPCERAGLGRVENVLRRVSSGITRQATRLQSAVEIRAEPHEVPGFVGVPEACKSRSEGSEVVELEGESVARFTKLSFLLVSLQDASTSCASPG